MKKEQNLIEPLRGNLTEQLLSDKRIFDLNISKALSLVGIEYNTVFLNNGYLYTNENTEKIRDYLTGYYDGCFIYSESITENRKKIQYKGLEIEIGFFEDIDKIQELSESIFNDFISNHQHFETLPKYIKRTDMVFNTRTSQYGFEHNGKFYSEKYNYTEEISRAFFIWILEVLSEK